MSWGGPEFAGMSTYDSHFNRPNVTFTASSGDNGAGLEWPAVSPSAGSRGDELYLDASYNRTSETAWQGVVVARASFIHSRLPERLANFRSSWRARRQLPCGPEYGSADLRRGQWRLVCGRWHQRRRPAMGGFDCLGQSASRRSGRCPAGHSQLHHLFLGPGQPRDAPAVNSTYFYDVSQGNNGLYDAGRLTTSLPAWAHPWAAPSCPRWTPLRAQTFPFQRLQPRRVLPRLERHCSYTVDCDVVTGLCGTVNLSATVQPLVAGATVSPTSISLTSGSSGSSTLAVPIQEPRAPTRSSLRAKPVGSLTQPPSCSWFSSL